MLFGVLIASGKRSELAVGYVIGAVLMIAAGLVEVWLGVNAEQKPLEEIATPLTAEDAGQHPADTGGAGAGTAAGAGTRDAAGAGTRDAAGTGTRDAAGTGQRRARRRVEPAVTPQANYRHWSPMYPAYVAPLIDTARDREVGEIVAALGGAGPAGRRQLVSRS